jgi:4,5-DOPA dioxygenase extradiol
MALLPFTNLIANLSSFQIDLTRHGETPLMPVLFLGHGSPMNAIEENEFTSGFRNIAKDLVKPKAILCISAHWETKGTMITAMDKPRTIHDFSGFPRKLYEVKYPAPGNPELAGEIKSMFTSTQVIPDFNWGFDHGTWSVVKHLYPDADVPLIQLSLDYSANPNQHFELARQLSQLRKRGVLIIGSGNMVHNLGKVAWDRLKDPDFGFDWAHEANYQMKKAITEGDHEKLINFRSQGKAWDLAIPTSEHFLPLLYIMALRNKKDETYFFNDKAVGGALTMTSVKLS